jgi:hypothetical protein
VVIEELCDDGQSGSRWPHNEQLHGLDRIPLNGSQSWRDRRAAA